MTCRWVFYFIPQYRVVEPLVLSVCIGAIFSVPYSVITVLIVAFMMGYTCVCVCVCVCVLCRLVLVLLRTLTCSTYNIIVAGGKQGEGGECHISLVYC